MYQDLIFRSLSEQFGNLRTPDEIRLTADPDDEGMVGAQQERLAEADGDESRPLYFQANFPVPVHMGAGVAWYMAGMGKAKYADGRPGEERERPSTAAERANLADISDIYVRPDLQRRGFGSALEREMLGHFPADMDLAVYEYPLINPLVVSRIREAGFSPAKERVVEFCGEKTLMVMYAGPACGDEIERLEAEKPWLSEREPITALAQA